MMIVIAAGAGGGVLVIVGIITVMIIIKRKKKKMLSLNGTSGVQSFNSTPKPIISKTIAIHPVSKTLPESYIKTKGLLSHETARENMDVNCKSQLVEDIIDDDRDICTKIKQPEFTTASG